MYQHTVLIVDDEKFIISAIQRALRKENYNLMTALSAEEGLKILQGREVNLVISDYMMPDMDGLTFLTKVGAEAPGTLTIMLTGQKDIEVAVRAINDAGVYKFILKPWDDEDFKITIRRALESLELMNERDTLRQRIKSRDAILQSLEKEHPGITKVDKDKDGYIHID